LDPLVSAPLNVPRYLCAACTFGQAISTAQVGEDRGSPAETGPEWGNRTVPGKNPNAKNANALRSAMAREFEGMETARMPQSGQRELGEDVRMGQKIDTIKEMEELKSELDSGNPAGGDVSNGGDSIGISLLDLAEILDQHKIWVESGGESGIKADLCGVNLAKADLT